MNFKFGLKSTLIFIAGLLLAAVVGVVFNLSALGFPIMAAVCFYLGEKYPARPR